jgi:hypothetical protein
MQPAAATMRARTSSSVPVVVLILLLCATVRATASQVRQYGRAHCLDVA